MHKYYTNKKVNKTLRDVNIEEHWLIKHIMSGKLIYFNHIKCHSDLERSPMDWAWHIQEANVPAKLCARHLHTSSVFSAQEWGVQKMRIKSLKTPKH